MSKHQEPLLPKPPGSGSPGDQAQEWKADSFDEARFIDMLKEFKNPFQPMAVLELKSEVVCSCSCRLGVIVGLDDGSVVLVGLDAEIRVLGDHTTSVSALCAANEIVGSGSSDSTVRIWDVEQREQLTILEGHTAEITCISISSDGKHIVSGSSDNTLRVWGVEERRELAVLEGHTSGVNCLSISSDGKHVTSGSKDLTVRIWDFEEKRQVAILEGHTRPVTCVSISTDGKHIVSGSEDSTLRIWDIEQGKEYALLEGHTSGVTCVSIASDRKHIVSGSSDKTVRIWDLEAKTQLSVLGGHAGGVRFLSISTDGRLIVSGSYDRTVRIWGLDERKQLAVLPGHNSGVSCLSISYDGKRIVAGSGDMSVLIWNIESKSQVSVLEGHTAEVTCLSKSSIGKFVSGSKDNTVRIWDIESKSQVAVIAGHLAEVTCVSISADGKRIASGSSDMTVRIWDSEGKKPLAVFEEHTFDVTCVSISTDGKRIVSGSSDMTVRIWDVEEKRQLGVLEGHSGNIYCVSISPDGKLIVSGSGDTTVRIWDLEAKTPLAVLSGHTSIVYCVSTDGKRIASGSSDKTVRIWDIEEKRLVAVLEGHSGDVWCLSISADGNHVVSGSFDCTLRIWSADDGRNLAVLEGHSDWITCVSISGDGKHIFSGSKDNTIRIWDLEEKKEIAVIQGHTSPVSCLVISADGKQLISGSYDKTIRVIDLVKILPLRFPLLSAALNSGELSQSKTCYFCGEYQEMLKQGTLIARSVAMSPILPHYFNSLHICVLYNKFEALKYYLEQGVPIIRGVFGSPLTIALEKNTTKCIDVILKHLTSTIEEKAGLLAIQEIVADFPKLLLCSVPSLVSFFSKLLGKPTQSLPDFLVPLRELPHIQFQGPTWVHIPDFAQFIGKDLLTLNGETVEFLISHFEWNFELGSTSSLTFLRALEDCKYRHILTTPLVTSLVQSKWEKLLTITRIHTLLYVFLLFCLVGLIFHYWRPEILNIVFISLNALFLLYEVVQSLANGTDYWGDPWNYVDLIRGITSVVWGYLVIREVEELQYLQFLVVCICFLRGFTFFRTFKMTRVFVRMVLEVVKEMYAFLVILAYTTCSFGMMYAVLVPDQIKGAPSAWTTAYELLMGEFNNDDFDLLKWLCFTAASLVNVIIMLNLLISILGDAYEKAQMSASESDNLEMLKLVIEYESMFFWRRNRWKLSVMVVCKSAGEEDTEDDWTGRVNQIKKTLEKNLKENEMVLGKKLEDDRSYIEKKMKESEITLAKKIEDKLKANETAVEKKLEAMEAKIDRVLAALEASH